MTVPIRISEGEAQTYRLHRMRRVLGRLPPQRQELTDEELLMAGRATRRRDHADEVVDIRPLGDGTGSDGYAVTHVRSGAGAGTTDG